MALVQAPTLAIQQPFKESTSFLERSKSSAKIRTAKLGHSEKDGEKPPRKRKSWQDVVRAVPRASANTLARANIPVIVQLHHQPGDLPDVPWNRYLVSSRSNIASLRSAIASDFKTAGQWEHPIHLFCTGNDVELDYSSSLQTLDNGARDDDGHVYVSVSALPGLNETTLEPIAEPERTLLLPSVVPRIYLELQEPQVLQPPLLPPLPSPPPPLPSPRPPPLEPLQPSLPLQNQKPPPKPPLEPALTSAPHEKICSICLIAVALIITLLTAMHFDRTAESTSPSAACATTYVTQCEQRQRGDSLALRWLRRNDRLQVCLCGIEVRAPPVAASSEAHPAVSTATWNAREVPIVVWRLRGWEPARRGGKRVEQLQLVITSALATPCSRESCCADSCKSRWTCESQ